MAPPPGMIPRKNPRTLPRIIAPIESRQSLAFGKRFFTFVVRISRLISVSRFESTSAMPNNPMTVGTRVTPSNKAWRLKVNRYCPLMASIPAPPSVNPTAAIIKAFSMDPLLRKVRTIIPTSISAKYSGGPNLRATRARGGPTRVRAMTENVPAINEPKAAIPSAGPALPLSAIW